MNRTVLGKGLEALIPKKPLQQEKHEFAYLPVVNIKLGNYQPRQEIDALSLRDLSRSIKEKGFIQPIVVRKTKTGEFEIVAGYRRFAVAKSLGIKEIPALVKDLNDKETFMLAIVENLQRTDLNPVEEAQAFKRLSEEFGLTQEEIGKFLGKDKSSIANILRLLKLPSDIQQALSKGLITRTQARTILSLNKEQEQRELFHRILKDGLSVRELERRVKKRSRSKVKPRDVFIQDMEERLQRTLGTKVRILNTRNNRGKIIIEYYKEEDLERIIRKLQVGR